jgi:NRAMP (natural resistance-associated macrophage protein)-like metal ion transporter
MAQSKVEEAEDHFQRSGPLGRLQVYLRMLGPGLITGASDDDPSGIGTYSQTGAQFGYSQLWTALLTFPLMTAIQEMCARIALETGAGLAAVIRDHYPKPILYFCVSLLVLANTINIGADLGAMAAAGQLLVNAPFLVWLLATALLTVALEIFVEYQQYARVLRFLTLSLFAYVGVVCVVSQDRGHVVRSTLLVKLRFDQEYWLNLVAILGTTISPYLFFWQAGQEIEEEIADGKVTRAARQGVSYTELKWMRTDVTAGMFFSNLVIWCIIVATASTLFSHGINHIDSAPQAAEALRPIAGDFAYLLFALGVIGTGLLAVPILAGSAAYAVAEAFELREGLYLKWRQAPGFYGVLAVATLVGTAFNVLGVNPMHALYYTAVLNGLVAPPLLVMIMLIANSRAIVEDRVNRVFSNASGWVTTLAMTAAAGALLISLVSE